MDATPGSLLAEFENARDAEYNRLRRLYPPVISVWRPHRSHDRSAALISRLMKAFAVRWWGERGFSVTDRGNGEFEAQERTASDTPDPIGADEFLRAEVEKRLP